jgi:hypothetical protein
VALIVNTLLEKNPACNCLLLLVAAYYLEMLDFACCACGACFRLLRK